jgi:hypothetical protein
MFITVSLRLIFFLGFFLVAVLVDDASLGDGDGDGDGDGVADAIAADDSDRRVLGL